MTDPLSDAATDAPVAGTPAERGELTDEDAAALAELSEELLVVYDPASGLRWSNRAHRRAFDLGDEEVAGFDLVELLHPDDRARYRDLVRQLCDGGRASVAARLRTAAGYRQLRFHVEVDPDSGLLCAAAGDRSDWLSAQQALWTTRQVLQAILDHATVGIFAKDLDGRYVLANQCFTGARGLTPADVVGKTAEEVFPGEGDVERDRRVMRTGVAHVTDEQVPLADGIHTVLVIRFPLRDATGAVIGLGGVVSDITDRVHMEHGLREKERLLDTLVQASPDIVTMIDADGRITEVSQAAQAILGLPPDLVHDELVLRLHPDDLPKAQQAFAALYAQQVPAVELRHRARHGDGHWVTFDSRARPIISDDGRMEGVVVVSRDVTADLAFEAELRAAVSRAEQANRAKSEFLSRMSHELRVPLNSVLGFAQLLQMEKLGPTQHEAVDHILQAGRHLLDLIDEVLDITRIETGHLDLVLEPVEVAPVVRDAVALTTPRAERHGLRVDVDLDDLAPGTHVVANRQRLLQVLLNLLSNGVKYNRPSGSLSVRVAMGPAAGPGAGPGDRVRIAVADTGRGIAEDDLPRLFEPFDRLGAERSGVEGTGVGLTLSKHLVERMHGRLEVRSVPGEGSTFTVELPRAPTPVAGGSLPRPPRPAPASGGAARVLHIEDNPANVQLVAQILQRRGGVRLQAASSGADGLAAATAARPDLVLLDLHLPDISGEEVLAQLHRQPATAAVPVVVVTADATPAQRRHLLQHGAAAYVTKPIDVRELLALVDQVLGTRVR